MRNALLLIGLTCIPGHTYAQGAKKGIYVAYGGKDQFSLEGARRIPAGALVSLHGYPLPKILPDVHLRRPDTGVDTALDVKPGADHLSWTALVPALPPNTRAEIVVTQFLPLERTAKDSVQRLISRMVAALQEAVGTRTVPADTDAVTMAQRIEAWLADRFPTEQLMPGYVVVQGHQTRVPLGQMLLEMFGRRATSDASLRNLGATYAVALRDLNEVVRGHPDAVLPSDYHDRIRALWSLLPDSLFSKKSEMQMLSMVDVLKRDSLPLPVDQETAAALRALITSAVPRELQAPYLREVDVVSLPLEQRFPVLFESVRRLETATYSVGSLQLPLLLADLQRYGTVDFIGGRFSRGGTAYTRGFLTFSFYPSGTGERTPHDAESRVTLTVGFSVAGGQGSQDFYLAGLTLRLTRYTSVTAGWVTPTNGGEFTCCFVGLAGDLTGLPFLNDLFAAKQ